MIDHKCFSKEWILNLRTKYPKTDPLLLEKTIHAFELLGLLQTSDESFIFKGGTALMLHLPELPRLSIDIDVIGRFSDDVLKKMTNRSVFTRLESDVRSDSVIPKKHYYFSFHSNILNKEDSILLDILEADNPYLNVVTKPIYLPLFEISQEQFVHLPTPEELLGDKLTAFAPNTIGILYDCRKSMDIIKQLFDIASLFDHVSNFQVIKSANQRIFQLQNSFYGNKHSLSQVLDDTIQTAFLICQLDLRKSIENTHTQELRRGIRQIRSHLLSARFTLPEVKIAASKSAFIAVALKLNIKDLDPFAMRFENTKMTDLREGQITGHFGVPDRLRLTLPEAYYYWHLISQWENE